MCLLYKPVMDDNNFSAFLFSVILFFNLIVGLGGNENVDTAAADQGQTSGDGPGRNFHPENEREETTTKGLEEFFKSLLRNSDVLPRKIFINDTEQSIKDFSAAIGVDESAIDSWPLTEENVLKTWHFVNVFVSCEYSDIVYNLLERIRVVFERYVSTVETDLAADNNDRRLKLLNEFFDKYDRFAFDHLFNHTSAMIYTLAGLAKFAKHNVSKKHDVLRLLLSWHLFTGRKHKDREFLSKTFKTIVHRADSLSITNYQVRKRVEQFMINNCFGPGDEFKVYRTRVENSVANHNNAGGDDFVDEKYLDEMNRLFGIIARPGLADTGANRKFIVNSYFRYEKLYMLLHKQTSSRTLMVRWTNKRSSNNNNNNGFDLNATYSKKLSGTTHVKTILKFEKLLLDKTIEMIVGYESSALKKIVGDNSGSDKSRMCNALLLEKIEEYIGKFKATGQPVYLINGMMSIKISLLYICFLMSSPDDKAKDYVNAYIRSLDLITQSDFNGTDFDAFLNSLSETVVCAKFHPVILDVFLNQMDTQAVMENGFLVDYQYLFTGYLNGPKNESFCLNMSSMTARLVALETKIENCSEAFHSAADASVSHCCFEEYNTVFRDVIVDIADVIINCTKQKYVIWDTFLLKLIYNQLHVELFDPKAASSLDRDGVRQLVTFTRVVVLTFQEHYHVYCDRGPSSRFEGLPPPPPPVDESFRCGKWEVEIGGVEDLRKIDRLSWIFGYEKHFRGFGDATRALAERFAAIEFKLPWGGAEMTPDEVHWRREHRAFDVRDDDSYSHYVLKWTGTLIYSRLMDIVAAQIETKDFKLFDFEKIGLETLAKELFDLDVYRMKQVRNPVMVTVAFIGQYGLYGGKDTERDMAYYKRELRDGFQYLGFVERSLPYADGIVSKRVYTLFLELKIVLDIFYETVVGHNAVEWPDYS